jgi:hypothetical protein
MPPRRYLNLTTGGLASRTSRQWLRPPRPGEILRPAEIFTQAFSGSRRPRNLPARRARSLTDREEREGREARDFDANLPRAPVERPLSGKIPRDPHEAFTEQ